MFINEVEDRHGEGVYVKGEYRAQGLLKATILCQGDLERLVDLVVVDVPRVDELEISTRLGTVSVRVNSVAEMLSFKGMPNRLGYLDIRAEMLGQPGEMDASIWLMLLRTESRLLVSSSNTTWGRGKFASLAEYLRSKRAWYWWLRDMLLSFPVVALLAGGLALYEFGRSGIISGASLVVFALVWLWARALVLRGRLLPQTSVILRAVPQALSTEKVMLLVELAALAAAVVGLFVR